MHKQVTDISYFPLNDGFEVVYSVTGSRMNTIYQDQYRRLAFCIHEQDAKDIVIALIHAHKKDLV